MTLTYTGDAVPREDLTGTNYKALDSDGKTVAVDISHSVERDYGLHSAQAMGIEKYSRGDIENDGTIRVTTSDFSQTT